MSRRLSLLLVALLAAAAPFRAAAEDLPVPDAAQEQQVRGYLAGLRSKDANVVHMAKRLLGRVDNVHRVVPWCEVLRGAREVAWRTRAAAELASFGDVRARDPLVAAATADRSADVRVAARVSLQSLRAPGTTQALARQLTNASTDVRVHAIEALAEQDDPLAAGLVVMRWHATSGDFPRVNFTTLRQTSYIQDFDVEVAATSFIADPVIGVLQDGECLDVKVLGAEHGFTTRERVAARAFLAKVAGRDLGSKSAAWLRWWRNLAVPELRRKRAASEGSEGS
ncbi:MAG: HEAT repeat domain-containing protein [Planctomycetes bacterium]|nr:HEAT repeat domain-containing protein [Planctomycetota bacterium]MCB9824811.1 HEAT repeat domain-containing protein [Planctomycetota bacterium]MCB9829297.1 HEAT repeat domain-containing protein [Planctomycetota bacterium]MCB9901783.1 HEAT repeat domain-containing protein [Planctomycetota bacterium]